MDSDKPYSLRELDSSLLQEAGLPEVSYHGLWRAGRQGTAARNGQRVYLKLDRIGGRLYTKLNWIREYVDELRRADEEHFRPTAQAEPVSGKLKKARLSRREGRLTEAMRVAEEEGL